MPAVAKTRKIVPVPVNTITGALAKMRLQEDWEMDELKASIRENGILNPLMLNKTTKGLILFAGHRRLQAAQELDFAEVPAIIYDNLPESEAALKGFIDNLNRKDFTPLEQAYAFKTLWEKYGFTHEDLAKASGKGRTDVTSYINIVKRVPQEIIDAIAERKISFGHAKLLMRLPDAKLMMKLFRELLAENISVEDLRFKIVRMKAETELTAEEKELDIVEDIIEDNRKLQHYWGTELNIHRSRIGDRLELDYRNSRDLILKLQTLLDALLKATKKKAAPKVGAKLQYQLQCRIEPQRTQRTRRKRF